MMAADQAFTVALWVIFAWMHDAAVHSPILLVSSPEPECGKTTLLGLVQLLTPRGLIFVDSKSRCHLPHGRGLASDADRG